MVIPAIVKVFIWALVPTLELRAAIPIGILIYKLNPFGVVFVAILADVLVAGLLLLALKPIFQWIKGKSNFFDSIFNWSSKKASLKTKRYLDKYGFIGLALFVGIPLPGTGVWTACLAAYVLNFKFKKAFLAISLGAFLAGIITLLLTLSSLNLEKYFGWKVFLGLIVVIVVGILTKKLLFKRKG